MSDTDWTTDQAIAIGAARADLKDCADALIRLASVIDRSALPPAVARLASWRVRAAAQSARSALEYLRHHADLADDQVAAAVEALRPGEPPAR